MINSKEIPLVSNQKYRLTVSISAKKGEKYAAYVLVNIQNSEGVKKKKIRWISDFSGKPKDCTIIFTSPPDAKNAVIGFRVNADAFRFSEYEIQFPEIESIKLQKESKSVEDSFDIFVGPPLPPLTGQELNELEKKMVWIFGSVRSGSTWLASQLLMHTENILWDEPSIGWVFNLIRPFGETMDLRDNPVYFFSKLQKHNWIIWLRRLILERTYGHAFTTSKNIIIKEPSGSVGADKILECLPNSKIIFLMRDGRDVVDSMIDALKPNSWWGDKNPIISEKDRISRIKEQSNSWKFSTETVWKAYQNHNEQLKLLVKYENLRKNTYGELKRIYEFIGIKIAHEMIKERVERYAFEKIPPEQKGERKFARLATPGAWNNNFSKKEQGIMNKIMGPTLKKFGYEI